MSAPSSDALCRNCRKLRLVETILHRPRKGGYRPNKQWSFKIDKLGNIRRRRSTCAFCMLLSQLADPDSAAGTKVSGVNYGGPEHSQSGMWIRHGRYEEADIWNQSQAASIDSDEDISSLEYGTVDFNDIRGRIDECEAEHNHRHLEGLSRYQHSIDLTFIDVQNCSLRQGNSSWRYFTLSYIWGGKVPFISGGIPRMNLYEDGALRRPEMKMAPVIEDAMEVVRKLHGRYLWVDALCIDQSSGEKHAQIAQMDVIFSQSVATLAALNARTANSRLAGIRPRTTNPDQPVRAIRTKIVTGSRYPCYRQNFGKRAWTYQECWLSRRCVMFAETGVYFCCSSNGFKPQPIEPTRSPGRDVLGHLKASLGSQAGLLEGSANTPVNWVEGFEAYTRMVDSYKKRHMTDSRDALNACMGIIGVLVHRFGGRTLCGLPEPILFAALLWETPVYVDHKRNVNFPSWSWAGWTNICEYGWLTFGRLKRLGWLKSEVTVLRSSQRKAVDSYLAASHHDKTLDLEDTSTLRFIAWTVPAHLVRPFWPSYRSEDPFSTRLALQDQSGTSCGTLSALSGWGRFRPKWFERCELTLIASGKAPKWPYAEGDEYQEGEWVYRHFMLIKWNGSGAFAERITIGNMNKDA